VGFGGRAERGGWHLLGCMMPRKKLRGAGMDVIFVSGGVRMSRFG